MYKKTFYITFFVISLSFPYTILQAAVEPDDVKVEQNDVKVEPDDVKAEPDDVIVEKNLFSPKRKKWIMERPKEKKKKEPKKNKKGLKKVVLFGTVITDKQSYAVLRTERKGKKKEFYMVGDYISGYLLKGIERKKVVLRDGSANKDYEIFINEGKKDRSAVKTEIKADEPVKRGRKAKKKGKKTKTPKPKKTKSAQFLMKRLEKDLKVLKRKDSKLVRKQAKKDYDKLQKLMPYMSDKDVKRAIELKNEIDESTKE